MNHVIRIEGSIGVPKSYSSFEICSGYYVELPDDSFQAEYDTRNGETLMIF